MKNIILYLLAMLVVSMPAVSALHTVEGGVIVIEQELNESLYAIGESVSVEEAVAGSVISFAGSVSINSPVEGGVTAFGGGVSINADTGGHITACGGSVSINSAMGGGLMACGGSINVNGAVDGDILAMGGSISINGRVTGTAVLMGGSVSVNGPVQGDVMAMAGKVTISGIIDGDVVVKAEELELKKDAVIKGDLTYTSPNVVFTEAQIEGSIVEEEATEVVPDFELPVISKTTQIIMGLITLLIVGIIIVLVAPELSNNLVMVINENWGQSLLFGLLALIVTPITAILFAITIVGIPIMVILFVLYALAIYFSKFITALCIGKRVVKDSKNLLLPMVAGIGIYVLLANLPVIGGFTKLLAVIFGLGAMTTMIFIKKKPASKTKKK